MPAPRDTGWSLLLLGVALAVLAACQHAAWLWFVAIVVLVVAIGVLAVSFANDADVPPDDQRP
ncbi:hypothetical protein [Actinomyces qiguomingii]|uniref:hypothetical protein n=1 Tax=Actinomyces qiguomingii TaxID=2057800 RepID=UPI000CA02A20|nr:hypothetical protein [Actinomyces qiguomingii]